MMNYHRLDYSELDMYVDRLLDGWYPHLEQYAEPLLLQFEVFDVQWSGGVNG